MEDNATDAETSRAGAETSSSVKAGAVPYHCKLNIDPEGDIIFDLKGHQLLVSAKALSLASPVFKAMLSKKYSDGANVSSECPGHTALSDDDPEAIIAIFYIIHHRSEEILSDITLPFLERVAFATDKYDCFAGIRSWSQLQLNILSRESKLVKNDVHLMFLAYMFEDTYTFKEMTKNMVYRPAGRMSDRIFYPSSWGLSRRCHERLPEKLLLNISQEEWQIKRELSIGIVTYFATRPPLCRHIPNETKGNVHVGLIVHTLEANDLWPLETANDIFSLEALFSSLQTFETKSPSWGSYLLDTGCRQEFFTEIKRLCDEAMSSFDGFDLDHNFNPKGRGEILRR